MKDLEEDADGDNTDGESPDKQLDSRDRREAYAQAQQSSDAYNSSNSNEFSQRFGNAHMNETALEYFQNANLAGKTSEQMI